jgi:hypothetical protein
MCGFAVLMAEEYLIRKYASRCDCDDNAAVVEWIGVKITQMPRPRGGRRLIVQAQAFKVWRAPAGCGLGGYAR